MVESKIQNHRFKNNTTTIRAAGNKDTPYTTTQFLKNRHFDHDFELHSFHLREPITICINA